MPQYMYSCSREERCADDQCSVEREEIEEQQGHGATIAYRLLPALLGIASPTTDSRILRDTSSSSRAAVTSEYMKASFTLLLSLKDDRRSPGTKDIEASMTLSDWSI